MHRISGIRDGHRLQAGGAPFSALVCLGSPASGTAERYHTTSPLRLKPNLMGAALFPGFGNGAGFAVRFRCSRPRFPLRIGRTRNRPSHRVELWPCKIADLDPQNIAWVLALFRFCDPGLAAACGRAELQGFCSQMFQNPARPRQRDETQLILLQALTGRKW